MAMLNLASVGQGTAMYGVQTNSAFVKCVAIKGFDLNPTEYKISVESVSIDDEFASIKLDSIDGVSATAGDTVYLEKGTVITFPEGSITLAESVDITDSYDFYSIYESHYDITDGSQSVVFGAVKLPVTNIEGWNLGVNNVDVKTMGHGEQQQNERVSSQWVLTLNLTIRPNDIGYFKHILPSAGFHGDFTGRVWIFAAVPSNNNGGFEYGFGSGLVSIASDPIPVNEVRRPVLQVEMQYPFLKTTNCANESESRKKLINIASKSAGVLPPCDYYELIVTNPNPANGQSFSVLFDSSEFGEFPYTITGVTSADISGEPLTGTLSNGDTLTFVNNVNADKTFTLSLDNGQAIVSASLTNLITSLSINASSVAYNGTFTVTFSSNQPGTFGYTITGVNSADINGASLTGSFVNDGDMLTLTNKASADKLITISLNNGQDSVSAMLDSCQSKVVSFSNPLSATLPVIVAENTGIYAGATYNVDTSGGFWRTTLTYGDEINGYAAYIEWDTGWSYTPTNANEIIHLTFSAETRFVDSPSAGSFPFILIAKRGAFRLELIVDNGSIIEWTLDSVSGIFADFAVGETITFSLARRNSSGITVGAPNQTTVIDCRNALLNINVGCS